MAIRIPDAAPKQRDQKPAETAVATDTADRTGGGYVKPNIASMHA